MQRDVGRSLSRRGAVLHELTRQAAAAVEIEQDATAAAAEAEQQAAAAVAAVEADRLAAAAVAEAEQQVVAAGGSRPWAAAADLHDGSLSPSSWSARMYTLGCVYIYTIFFHFFVTIFAPATLAHYVRRSGRHHRSALAHVHLRTS